MMKESAKMIVVTLFKVKLTFTEYYKITLTFDTSHIHVFLMMC